MLNSEITAPQAVRVRCPSIRGTNDSTARGVSNTSMAPAYLQGALFNICMAPVHLQGALTSPCVRQFLIPTRGSVCPPTSKGGNFLTKWRFQRNVAFSHLASRDARRRAPRVPFGTTQEEFSFVFNMQVLLPALHPIDRAPARAHSTNPGHAHTRRRSTTRLRVHTGKIFWFRRADFFHAHFKCRDFLS